MACGSWVSVRYRCRCRDRDEVDGDVVAVLVPGGDKSVEHEVVEGCFLKPVRDHDLVTRGRRLAGLNSTNANDEEDNDKDVEVVWVGGGVGWWWWK